MKESWRNKQTWKSKICKNPNVYILFYRGKYKIKAPEIFLNFFKFANKKKRNNAWQISNIGDNRIVWNDQRHITSRLPWTLMVRPLLEMLSFFESTTSTVESWCRSTSGRRRLLFVALRKQSEPTGTKSGTKSGTKTHSPLVMRGLFCVYLLTKFF